MAKKIATNDFDVILERIKQEAGIKSMRQLAEIIGIKHQTISAARKKNEFPANWAYILAKKYTLLTEWIMTGEEPKKISEGVKINPLLVDVNEWLNEEERDKSEKFRALFEQQMIRAFFDYEAWRRKRDEQEGGDAGRPSRKVA